MAAEEEPGRKLLNLELLLSDLKIEIGSKFKFRLPSFSLTSMRSKSIFKADLANPLKIYLVIFTPFEYIKGVIFSLSISIISFFELVPFRDM